VLSVLLLYTDSDYPFGIFKLFIPSRGTRVILCGSIFGFLCSVLFIIVCLFFPFWIILLYVLLRFTASDYHVGFFKLLLVVSIVNL